MNIKTGKGEFNEWFNISPLDGQPKKKCRENFLLITKRKRATQERDPDDCQSD